MKPSSVAALPFTPYQSFVVAMLSFLQFTVVLDFMILSPLGAVLMPSLGISAAQFGTVVSAYAFSAGISGFFAAGFADRYDRKKLLLFFYVGFLVGTLLCGMAHTYEFLLIARIITGIFGGVIGSITFAVTTDLFSYEQRGRVMGIVQSSFAAAQVLGIPIGLYLANHYGWGMPFYLIVGVGVLAGFVIAARLQPIEIHPEALSRSPYRHLLKTVSNPRYIQGFAATALLTIGGFMIMPFASAFMVGNLGIRFDQLPIVYIITGFGSIATGLYAGRATDRFGKMRVFGIASVVNLIFLNLFCHLEITPIAWVIAINIALFASGFCRMIASSALMSVLPVPAERGAYMAVSSSIQQVSGGVAAVLSGMIVVQTATGRIEHFDQVAYVVSGSAIATWIMLHLVDRYIRQAGLAR